MALIHCTERISELSFAFCRHCSSTAGRCSELVREVAQLVFIEVHDQLVEHLTELKKRQFLIIVVEFHQINMRPIDRHTPEP